MNKRKILLIIFSICTAFALTACKDTEKALSKPIDVVESFFTAFESSDYEAMKTYCTEGCIESYFHDGDVDGMVWAKLTQSGEIVKEEDNIIYIFVTVEIEPAKISSLYPDTNTSFYVELVQNENGSWLINGFPTGI